MFALTGTIRNTGLIEVPMGPSSGCIPAHLLDTPVSYESLRSLRSIMGSGGMIVMDTTTNMVEIARFYMEFCRGETCGKCVPCRTGTVHLYALLTKILKGQATAAALAQLEALCAMVQDTSLCGLGQTAPNPVLSTLKYFRSEYEDLLITPAYLNDQVPAAVGGSHG